MMNRAESSKILIPYLGEPLLPDYQGVVSNLKSKGAAIQIDQVNWSDFPYRPAVQLFIGYSGEYLWLHYQVENDFFRAMAKGDQGSVWEDSCVEFFLSTETEKYKNNFSEQEIAYRNFEFNASGVCLSAFGTKSDREFLKTNEMGQILRFPGRLATEMPQEGSEFDWELAVAIPLALLGLEAGSSFWANFYKCGDLTTKPHFLSWKEISSEEPDFHLPEFFGEAVLLV